ncbi:MAG: T9SS type A sorting domain-containing protein, partial [Bacteroidota bacterium]
AITPEIKIEMYDNSILEVNIKSLSARINGRMQCVTGDSCDFYSNREERPLKATLTFKSDSMDFGQNLITVYAIDGSGNRDTTRVSVYVSKGGYVENLYNFPNPFDNGTTFSFNYKAPQNSGEALIEMFDLMGRPVKTIRHPVTLGKNFIEWNGLDNSNSRLASGVYFYRMSILSDSYVETHYGKIMAN